MQTKRLNAIAAFLDSILDFSGKRISLYHSNDPTIFRRN